MSLIYVECMYRYWVGPNMYECERLQITEREGDITGTEGVSPLLSPDTQECSLTRCGSGDAHY